MLAYDRRATFSNVLGTLCFAALWALSGVEAAGLFLFGFVIGGYRTGLP